MVPLPVVSASQSWRAPAASTRTERVLIRSITGPHLLVCPGTGSRRGGQRTSGRTSGSQSARRRPGQAGLHRRWHFLPRYENSSPIHVPQVVRAGRRGTPSAGRSGGPDGFFSPLVARRMIGSSSSPGRRDVPRSEKGNPPERHPGHRHATSATAPQIKIQTPGCSAIEPGRPTGAGWRDCTHRTTPAGPWKAVLSPAPLRATGPLLDAGTFELRALFARMSLPSPGKCRGSARLR
jgi:hypothetical protein